MGRGARPWAVETSRGAFTADVFVPAVGALCEPALPDIKGIETFAGEIFHSARWNHDADLAGKRVAVIGTGASAIQIVPAIADQVGSSRHLSAHGALGDATARPRLQPAREAGLPSTFPGLQRLAREAIYWGRELFVLGFAFQPKILLAAQRIAERNIEKSIRDDELRAPGDAQLADRLQADPDLERLVPDAGPRARRAGQRRHRRGTSERRS